MYKSCTNGGNPTIKLKIKFLSDQSQVMFLSYLEKYIFEMIWGIQQRRTLKHFVKKLFVLVFLHV